MGAKNVAICQFIMFNPRVMVIKMSKMTHAFVYSVNGNKKSVTVQAKYLSAPEFNTNLATIPWIIV